MRGKSFLFFSTAILGMAAIFIISAPNNAKAYAISSTGQPLGAQSSASAGTSTNFDGNYDFNGSFQNLISPFKSFFNNLSWNTSTVINIHPTSTILPPVNITPGVQNIFIQFDNWFYSLTNIRLSGFAAIILSGLSWTLGVAKGIADWLLGLIP